MIRADAFSVFGNKAIDDGGSSAVMVGEWKFVSILSRKRPDIIDAVVSTELLDLDFVRELESI